MVLATPSAYGLPSTSYGSRNTKWIVLAVVSSGLVASLIFVLVIGSLLSQFIPPTVTTVTPVTLIKSGTSYTLPHSGDYEWLEFKVNVPVLLLGHFQLRLELKFSS